MVNVMSVTTDQGIADADTRRDEPSQVSDGVTRTSGDLRERTRSFSVGFAEFVSIAGDTVAGWPGDRDRYTEGEE